LKHILQEEDITYDVATMNDVRSVPVIENLRKILSIPQPSVYPINMMSYFQNYSPLLWAIFLSLLVMTAVVLRRLLKCTSRNSGSTLLEITWKLLSVTLRNGNYNCKFIVSMVLLACFILGSLLYTKIFENLINTDHVVRNESTIIDSFDDLMKHPEKIVLVRDLLYEEMKSMKPWPGCDDRRKEKLKKRIYNRILCNPMNETTFSINYKFVNGMHKYRDKQVVIASRYDVDTISGFICYFGAGNKLTWISKEKFFPEILAFRISKNITKEKILLMTDL